MFTAGDVVQLKSGGQKMTVEGVEGDDVDCVWFDGSKANRHTFAAAALKKVDTGPGVVGVKLARG